MAFWNSNNEKKADAPKKAAAKTAATKAVAAKPAVSGVVSISSASHAIIRPHVTEKSGILSQGGVYTFQVANGANKVTVSEAVKALYKVTPTKVAIINLPKKQIFVKGRWGSVPAKRKAMVTLKKGDKIDFV